MYNDGGICKDSVYEKFSKLDDKKHPLWGLVRVFAICYPLR
jgi:hypothetical protein